MELQDLGVESSEASQSLRLREERKAIMGFLHRHDEQGGTRYQMREKLFSIGDDFWIETEEGERAFKVNGKALRIRDTFVLESPSGDELFKIQEKKLRIRDTMKIERDGDTVATVKKALITPLRDRFAIEVENDDELSAKGNIVDHEYEIERDGAQGRRDLKALVPDSRHIRDRDRPGTERRADPRRDRLHRRDVKALIAARLMRSTRSRTRLRP